MRFPMFGGLWPIRPRDALREPVAGLTLASMNIPQILGYTRIAGTPVVTGLYGPAAAGRLRGVRLVAPSRRGRGFRDGGDICEFAVAHGRTG